MRGAHHPMLGMYRWLDRHRAVICWVLLASFAVTSLRLLPSAKIIVQITGLPLIERFPCQDSSCGCSTAEECWSNCCCHSTAERLAWAARENVTPPDFVLADLERAGVSWRSHDAGTVLAASQASSCCSSDASSAAASCCSTLVTATPALPSCCQPDGKVAVALASDASVASRTPTGRGAGPCKNPLGCKGKTAWNVVAIGPCVPCVDLIALIFRSQPPVLMAADPRQRYTAPHPSLDPPPPRAR